MARTIPLIRAAAIFPTIRWLNGNGYAANEWLAAVGLNQLREDARERPIPLLKGLDLFRMLATEEGPDACARVVSPHSFQDLGVLGEVILGSRTPRAALSRVVHLLPRYATHEIVALRPIPGGLRLQAGWSLVLDQELMHLTQQFTAALIVGLCLASNQPAATPRAIKIRPHPQAGIDHLRHILGNAVAATDEAVLSVDLDDRVLDAPLHALDRGGSDLPPPDWVMPQGEGSFSASVCLALEALDSCFPARLDQVAALAGLSTRSFQRMLARDGTSFRSLLDSTRRARAIEVLCAENGAGRLVAEELGFSGPSSFTRAVRRWTGVTPKHLRKGALAAADPQ